MTIDARSLSSQAATSATSRGWAMRPSGVGLIDELRTASPEFARLWDRHDVHAPPTLTKTFRHPVVGEITVDCDSLTLTDRDQHLVLYSAPPGSHDADTLAFLDALGTENVNASKPR